MLTSNGYLLDESAGRLGELEAVPDQERGDRQALRARLGRDGYLFLRGVLDPEYNLHGTLATTHSCAPMVMVSGPIRHELNINCGSNCFGQGRQANATIGRALGLMLLSKCGVDVTAAAELLEVPVLGGGEPVGAIELQLQPARRGRTV